MPMPSPSEWNGGIGIGRWPTIGIWPVSARAAARCGASHWPQAMRYEPMAGNCSSRYGLPKLATMSGRVVASSCTSAATCSAMARSFL